MKPTKKQLEKALELAVKTVVHYNDDSDCNGRCPLINTCPIPQTHEYFLHPQRRCKRLVEAEYLRLAKEAK